MNSLCCNEYRAESQSVSQRLASEVSEKMEEVLSLNEEIDRNAQKVAATKEMLQEVHTDRGLHKKLLLKAFFPKTSKNGKISPRSLLRELPRLKRYLPQVVETYIGKYLRGIKRTEDTIKGLEGLRDSKLRLIVLKEETIRQRQWVGLN